MPAILVKLELLGPHLTAEQAEQIYRQGKEAVVFALLHQAKLLAEQSQPSTQQSPSTPSGMTPPFLKPSARPRRKKPGRKRGHAGVRRPTPDRIDRREEHRAEACPSCGGPLQQCQETRTRYVEDIPLPETLQPQVTEHTIHRDWCPNCQKQVEPRVPDALPGATLGNRVVVLAAWLHYALGNTLSQITEVFNFHLQLKISAGGLTQMFYRLQEILYAWYEQIQQQALSSAVLHADESGWRVNGKTHWLWCFATRDLTYYMIDRCRGAPGLMKFFTREFAGTLVTDFWGAYNAVACALRQTCLVHLLRDLEFVEQYKHPGTDWPQFAKKLRRMVRDAIRLWRRQEQMTSDRCRSRRDRLHGRLKELIETPWKDSQARRLVKRLRRHQSDLFTFLDQPGVPFDNNAAERAIRPAVIIRKNSYGNRSEEGADTQAVLMSVFRTLKQRGHDPIRTVVESLATYLKTGQLPPLPAPKETSDANTPEKKNTDSH
jgi:transposase